MEGKETRFGIVWSVPLERIDDGHLKRLGQQHARQLHAPWPGWYSCSTLESARSSSAASGVGLIGMLFYVILSMFVAGLMIGRTPEFMGKKFGPYEMVMAMISMLLPMISMVIFSAIAISTKTGLSSLNNPSSHGLSEILYAYTSGHGNNGSAFAGLNANTVFYNTTIGIAMLIGRFATILPALAVAGSLAKKKIVPETSATFPTTGIMFIIILVSVIFIMGALTFFPVYSLGPILEHLFVNQLKLF